MVGDNIYRAFSEYYLPFDLYDVVFIDELKLIPDSSKVIELHELSYKDMDNDVYLDKQIVLTGGTYINGSTTYNIQHYTDKQYYNPSQWIVYNKELDKPLEFTVDGNFIIIPGDVRDYTLIYGKPYNLEYEFQRYLPRDSYGNILQFRRINYRKIIMSYIGVDLKLIYGNKDVQYIKKDTGVMWGNTILNRREVKNKSITSVLSGYEYTFIKVVSDTVFPLTLSSVSFYMNEMYGI